MKKSIELNDYLSQINSALTSGILLTTKAGDRVNTMTIGWAQIGVIWGRPIASVFVRESRFSFRQLLENPEFTLNIPRGALNRQILGRAGTQSGRDIDKIKELGLTLEESSVISVPGIKEFPLTLECSVLYSHRIDPKQLPVDIQTKSYPVGVSGSGANESAHWVYCGEIKAAYLID